MILLASPRRQSAVLETALENAAVPFAPVRETKLIDTDPGRAAYALLSIVVNPENYVAHRTLLGVRRGVGIGTCNAVAQAVVENHRNYRELFYSELPDGLLTPRARRAVGATAAICSEIATWSTEDELLARMDDICGVVEELREEGASEPIRAACSELPDGTTLGEAHAFLAADNDEGRRRVLSAIAERLGQPVEELAKSVPERVQMMTMHGAKGLAAQIVFIPGLEEEILPGEKRKPYPGLVLEAARMLYVSITRGRVACILSYASERFVNGAWISPTPSRFTSALGAEFRAGPASGISPEVAEKAAAQIANMQ